MAKFISFEGTPGCGKTTQIKKLSDKLNSAGYEIVIKDWGIRKKDYLEYENMLNELEVSLKKGITDCLKHHKKIYYHLGLPYTEIFLVLARYAIDWDSFLNNIMNKNNLIIIADRDIDTFYAHQLVTLKKKYSAKDKFELLEQMRNVVLTWFKEPELTFYIKVPIDTAINRLINREKRTISLIDKEYMIESISNYDFLASQFKRFIVIDGKNNVETIHKKIFENTMKYINKN